MAKDDKTRHITNNENTLIACRLPKDDKDILRAKADALGISINALAQGILLNYIRKEL